MDYNSRQDMEDLLKAIEEFAFGAMLLATVAPHRYFYEAGWAATRFIDGPSGNVLK